MDNKDNKLGSDIIDGKIINWDDLTQEQLKELKLKYEKKQKEILAKIEKELKLDENENNKEDDNIR